MNITTYANTKEAGIYNQNYFVMDGKLGIFHEPGYDDWPRNKI